MKQVSVFLAVMVLMTVFSSGVARAGAPFVNLEGVGGVALNPLAYPAATPGEEGFKVGGIEIAKPRLGTFYTNLNDTDVDWTTMGIATTVVRRLELSFGYESVAIAQMPKNTHKDNIGAKLLLLDENAFGSTWVPAVAVGGIWKKTSFPVMDDLGADGFDVYLVATKLMTRLPVPVLLSAGVLSTQGHVNGVLGFDDKRKEVFFGNVEVFPTSWLAVGVEYKQGPNYSVLPDADYFDIHAGWMATRNLTLVAAYMNGGDRHSTRLMGLGGGAVVSAQYAF